jgi:hypothetical protein
MNLTKSQRNLLIALADGNFLKSHRYLDGTKVFQLHALDGQTNPAARQDVAALVDKGYVSSNQKFPAATYMLTEKGRAYAATHAAEKSD